MYKIDFHTHSTASADGGISADQYAHAIQSGVVDMVAVTDHNTIDFALSLQQRLGGERIIVGEEISTPQGDIIGLYLKEAIPAGLDIIEAIARIKQQDGLVYIPHPFETIRSGISQSTLEMIADEVDIIESANGRALFQNFGPAAHTWARLHHTVTTASSDAHRAQALGKTYTLLSKLPEQKTLMTLLKTARKQYSKPSIGDILAPKLNSIKKKIR